MVAAQMPIEEKRALANYVIDNSGSREATYEQVQKLWKDLAK
jgi:dephospho-CoA kinase